MDIYGSRRYLLTSMFVYIAIYINKLGRHLACQHRRHLEPDGESLGEFQLRDRRSDRETRNSSWSDEYHDVPLAIHTHTYPSCSCHQATEPSLACGCHQAVPMCLGQAAQLVAGVTRWRGLGPGPPVTFVTCENLKMPAELLSFVAISNRLLHNLAF